MSDDKKHPASRESLEQAIKQLIALGAQRKSQRLQDRAEKLMSRSRKFTFNLVVIGEFKRGKSTLVNALIGAPILPTASVPLTSVATVVRYGDKEALTIHLLDGKSIQSGIETLKDYVTESGNPLNKRGVDIAELEFPAQLLRDGVRIIDTPGTGSIYLHNSKTTHDFLPEADAIMFVFIADQPATRAELDLLNTSKQFSARHFFVLNKIDHLDRDSQKESLTFLKTTLEAELNTPCTVYPVSAKSALEAKKNGADLSASGFIELERALLQFELRERSTVLLESLKSKTQSLIRETEQLIELERQSVAMPEQKLEDSLTHFKQAQKQILREQADADLIVKGEIQNLVKVVEFDLQPLVDEHKSFLQRSIEEEYQTNRNMDKDTLIEHMRCALKQHITSIFEQWRVLEEKKIQASFVALNERFVARGNAIIAEIARLTYETFAVKVSTHFESETLIDKNRHRYAVDNPFNISFKMLPLLLPDSFSKEVIHQRFMEVANDELLRNSGRLRADYQERLEASGQKFLKNFREMIAASLDEIENIILHALRLQKTSHEERIEAEKVLALQEELISRIELLL